MGFLLGSSSGQLLLVLMIVFAVFSAMMIPAYFIALRPQRGTTEWMKRLDRPKFAPLHAQKLRWGDIAWALLSGFCAAMMRLISYLLAYFRMRQIDALPKYFESLLLYRLIPCAVLGIALYLLLRSLFDKTLPAVCGAILGGLAQIDDAWAGALVALSFMLLWYWMAADADAPIFPRALMLLGSLACFVLTVTQYWAVVWLAPVYFVAYLYAQIYRWRKTTKPGRAVSLAISLLLLFFAAVGAVVALWVFYCYLSEQPENITNLRKLVTILPQKLLARLEILIAPLRLRGSIYGEDAFLFTIGVISYVPILHGIFKRRDSRCIVLLLLQVPFAAMWFLGGMYLAVPVMIPAVAWVWNTFAEREHSGSVICFALGTALMYLVEHFI